MAAGMPEKYGIIGRNGTDTLMGRKTLHQLARSIIPFILMPSSSLVPLSRHSAVHCPFYLIHHLLIAGDTRKVDVEFIVSQRHEVAVPFNKPGRHSLSFQVDDLSMLADMGLYPGFGPGIDDRVGIYSHRLHDGILVV